MYSNTAWLIFMLTVLGGALENDTVYGAMDKIDEFKLI